MLTTVLKFFRDEMPAPVPAAAGVGLGPIAREAIRPLQADLPQHLTLPTEPFVILAHHPHLDVLVARLHGSCWVCLYAAGQRVTDLTVVEASWLCSGPTELVRKTLAEKFEVTL